MKRAVFFLLFSGAFGTLSAQNTQKLIAEFGEKQKENETRFEKYFQQNSGKITAAEKAELSSRLAGFAGNIPVFYEEGDKPANRSANIIDLQNGTLAGLSGIAADGTGIQVLVMDGGRIHDTHEEFGGPVNGPLRVVNLEAASVAKSSHTASVTSIILGDGDSTGTLNWSGGGSSPRSDAQGVLPKANSVHYTFTSTALGNNYQKLAAATNANISNHSYGVNLGWARRTSPTLGWYWVGNLTLNAQDTYSGSYYTNDESFDKIVYDNPNHIVVKSAGNYFGDGPGGPTDPNGTLPKFKYDDATDTYIPFEATDPIPPINCSQGFNCIGWGSLSKNIIVVGATNQLTTPNNQYQTSTDVVKAGFSNAGPRKDGAVKPDLSAVGVSMVTAAYSTSNPASNTAYSRGSGTSYAAPIVTGIAGALTQIERNLSANAGFTFKADEMKALLIHSANEAGNPGPDVWYGWGFADATKAAQILIERSAVTATFERNLLTSGVLYTKEVTAAAGEPLKATISWVDPAAVPFTTDNDLQNNNSSRLINDMDLRIVDTSDNSYHLPWKLNIADPMADATKGDNLVDNVEVVLLENPVPGRTYRIEVSNKGTLVNAAGQPASQNYALIITGYQEDVLASNEVDLKKSVALYPTRTKAFVTIVSPVKIDAASVYDMSGKSVLQISPKNNQMVDLSQLPAGVYIFNIKTEKGTVTKKVIKE